MRVLLLCLLYAAVFAIQVPGIVRRKDWRDLIVYSTFMLFSFAIALVVVLGVGIPSPTDLIVRLIGGFAMRFMEAEPTVE